MPLRVSHIDRIRAAERQEHQRQMFEAHHETRDGDHSADHISIIYPPPTILAPETVGRGASEYYRPTSFVAGPEYMVDDAMLASSPANSRPVSRF